MNLIPKLDVRIIVFIFRSLRATSDNDRYIIDLDWRGKNEISGKKSDLTYIRIPLLRAHTGAGGF